jgi:hypothetical protein
VLAGCARDETTVPDAAADSAATPLAGDSFFDPSEGRVSLPTGSIYYTLTSYDWYARGQPLLHDGRAYTPGGMPVSASLQEMSKAGTFEGVDYYISTGDAADAVYVPVFDGYWQRFQVDPSAPAQPQDADDVAADSAAVRD